MNRLVQWDPFRIRVNSDAVAALIRDRVPAATLVFNDGFIEAGAASFHARITLAATSPQELRLAIAVKDDVPAIVVTVSLATLLPGFVDLVIAGAEITREGVIVSLGPGGADPPPA